MLTPYQFLALESQRPIAPTHSFSAIAIDTTLFLFEKFGWNDTPTEERWNWRKNLVVLMNWPLKQ